MTRTRIPKAPSRRILKHTTRCGNAACENGGMLLAAGSQGWWFPAAVGHSTSVRCLDCGPHPMMRTEPGPFADLTPPTPEPAPMPVPAETPVNGDLSRYLTIARAERELDKLRAELALRPIVTRIELVSDDRPMIVIDGAHKSLAEMIGTVKAGLQNILLVGPAGSGKTTLASQLAKALSLEFGFLSLSAGVSESKLTGALRPKADGSWVWWCPAFLRVFEFGGVFLLDEIDAADANVLVSVNAALANGEIEVDGKIIKRHANCIIVAAANTYGTGSDARYVGRNQLDAATLDRFVGATLAVDYDRDVELTIATQLAGKSASELCHMVWNMREAAQKSGLSRIIGTRMVKSGALLIRHGMSLTSVRERLIVGWSTDERRKIGA